MGSNTEKKPLTNVSTGNRGAYEFALPISMIRIITTTTM